MLYASPTQINIECRPKNVVDKVTVKRRFDGRPPRHLDNLKHVPPKTREGKKPAWPLDRLVILPKLDEATVES